jgi:imidazolonepropionase-like amidohydrolase
MILAGTDTGDSYVLPGFTLHSELALLVQAGLTPLEALQSATINPARYFQIQGTTGSIERGKTADMVLLDGDPLNDIRNTTRIAAVVVRGKLLDAKRLAGLLRYDGSAHQKQ